MYWPPGIRDIGGMQIAAHQFSSGTVALMGVSIPASEEPPEWIHLLPTSAGRIETNDGRGPYFVADAAALIAASLAGNAELPLDENHATDLTPGAPSPARGWITAMEARADGIWGKVRWTKSGRELVADQAYRGISPVFLHTDDKTVQRILRASLVNNPNLRGLATLHQEGNVNFMERLAEKLGLNAAATEDQILAALPAKPGDQIALQAALPDLRSAFGLAETADMAAVLAAAQAAGRDVKTTMPALQAQVTELSGKLTAMQDAGKKAAAETFIDAEIKAGRMGLNAQNRDEFVAMHRENPERTEKLVKGFALMPGRINAGEPPPATQHANATDLVTKAKALQAAEAAKGINIDWITAVQRASEAK